MVHTATRLALRCLVLMIVFVGVIGTAEARRGGAVFDPNESRPISRGNAYNDPVSVTASVPVTRPQKPRQMSGLEQGIWTAVKSLGSATGSTLGASVGMVAVPAAITAIVGALGISTSGAGFVSAVLIPYSPVIGKFVGSAVGAGLFSGVINTAFELRMQKFREQKKSGREIARTVFKTAVTDAMLAPVTLGLGGGGAAAAGKGLGEMAKEVFKTASVQFLGNAIMTVAGKAMGQQYTEAGDSMSAEAAAPVEPSGIPPQAVNDRFAAGTIPIMTNPAGMVDESDPGADAETGARAGAADQESSYNVHTNAQVRDTRHDESAAGTGDELMRTGSGAQGNRAQTHAEPSPGFSNEVEHAAWQSLLSSRLGVTAVLIPRSVPGAIAMHWHTAYAFSGSTR